MSCETMQERITTRLAGELAPAEAAELERHLAECPACSAEAEALAALWQDLGDLPAESPSARSRQRFDGFLAAEIARAGGRPVAVGDPSGAADSSGAQPAPGRPRTFSWFGLPGLALAATLVLGLGLGFLLARRDGGDVAALRREVGDLHEMVARSLLEQRSVSERLKGVAYTRDHSREDERLTGVLFSTMLADPNVNVRLAALEALKPLAGRPAERSRLVAAVERQDSPLVQLSLIDLLIESDSAAARRDLAALLDNPNLDPTVRAYLRDRLGRSV